LKNIENDLEATLSHLTKLQSRRETRQNLVAKLRSDLEELRQLDELDAE
jgi:hypothetical protein